jgi:Periplasmic binding protein-like domain
MLAVGCYSALEEAGLRCPEDVSVVGFNDMPFIDRLRPALTSVRFPHYQVGTEAAQLLLERIGQRDGHPATMRGRGSGPRSQAVRARGGQGGDGGDGEPGHSGEPGRPGGRPADSTAGVKMLFLAPELVVRGSTAPAAHRSQDGKASRAGTDGPASEGCAGNGAAPASPASSAGAGSANGV